MVKSYICCFTITALIACNLPVAKAATITKDGKGNIFVHAYGESLKFAKTGAEQVVLSFLASKCDQKSRVYLGDIINTDDVVKCVTNDENSTRTSNTSPRGPDVFAILPVVANEKNEIYSLAVEALPTVQVIDPIIKSTATPSFSLMYHLPKNGPRCSASGEGNSDLLGYKKRDVATNPKGVQFTLEGSQRNGTLIRPLCISCGPLFAFSTLPESRWLCSTSEFSSDGTVAVSFKWLTPDFPKPTRDWTTFDSFTRAIARGVFSERKVNDFQ
jgi:hypothetical protein